MRFCAFQSEDLSPKKISLVYDIALLTWRTSNHPCPPLSRPIIYPRSLPRFTSHRHNGSSAAEQRVGSDDPRRKMHISQERIRAGSRSLAKRPQMALSVFIRARHRRWNTFLGRPEHCARIRCSEAGIAVRQVRRWCKCWKVAKLVVPSNNSNVAIKNTPIRSTIFPAN
jgi:hypothetical protein